MGLCGLLNRRNVYDFHLVKDEWIGSSINAFVQNNMPDDNETFSDPIVSKYDFNSIPNNSVEYAMFLLYQTANISPIWSRVFFLDLNLYSKLRKAEFLKWDCDREQSLTIPTFLLLAVANFAELDSIDYAVLGSFSALKTLGQISNNLNVSNEPIDIFATKFKNAWSVLESFDISFEACKSYLEKIGLHEITFWNSLVKNLDLFNKRVNSVIASYCYQHKTIKSEDFSKPPSNFINMMERDDGDQESDDRTVATKFIETLLGLMEDINKQHPKLGERKPENFLSSLTILGTL